MPYLAGLGIAWSYMVETKRMGHQRLLSMVLANKKTPGPRAEPLHSGVSTADARESQGQCDCGTRPGVNDN